MQPASSGRVPRRSPSPTRDEELNFGSNATGPSPTNHTHPTRRFFKRQLCPRENNLYPVPMLLAIRVPADNQRGPRFMQEALAAIHQANHRRAAIRLEFGCHAGRVGLFCRVPDDLTPLVVGPIAAKYPQCRIEPIDNLAVLESSPQTLPRRPSPICGSCPICSRSFATVSSRIPPHRTSPTRSTPCCDRSSRRNAPMPASKSPLPDRSQAAATRAAGRRETQRSLPA